MLINKSNCFRFFSKAYKQKIITVIQLQYFGIFSSFLEGDLPYFIFQYSIFFYSLRVPCKTHKALQFTLKHDYSKPWLGK